MIMIQLHGSRVLGCRWRFPRRWGRCRRGGPGGSASSRRALELRLAHARSLSELRESRRGLNCGDRQMDRRAAASLVGAASLLRAACTGNDSVTPSTSRPARPEPSEAASSTSTPTATATGTPATPAVAATPPPPAIGFPIVAPTLGMTSDLDDSGLSGGTVGPSSSTNTRCVPRTSRTRPCLARSRSSRSTSARTPPRLAAFVLRACGSPVSD
jgi:hypothetical protein